MGETSKSQRLTGDDADIEGISDADKVLHQTLGEIQTTVRAAGALVGDGRLGSDTVVLDRDGLEAVGTGVTGAELRGIERDDEVRTGIDEPACTQTGIVVLMVRMSF